MTLPAPRATPPLTPRDRLLTTLRGLPADRPPVICPGGMMTMAIASAMQSVVRTWPAAHFDADAMAEVVLATQAQTGLECLAVPFCMTIEAEALGCRIDMGNSTVLPHVAATTLSVASTLDSLPLFDPEKSGRAPVVLKAISRLKAALPSYPVIGAVVGPITLAEMIMEPGLFLRLVWREPARAEQVVARMELVTARFALAQRDAGADAVMVAEPSATGEVLGGKHFARLAAPAITRVLISLRDSATPPILHICGNLRPILTSLAEIARQTGFLALSVDAMVSGAELKSNLPQAIRIGNVDTFLLQRGTPEVIEQLSLNAARNFHVVSPACGLVPTTPSENLSAMVRGVKKFCAATGPEIEV